MSDEEKEALEILNNTEWDGFMIIIKNLIEKQSKEIQCDNLIIKRAIEIKDKQSKKIEELKAINKMQEYRINEMDIPKSVAEQKERKAYIKGTNDADELCNKKWKDKIKAKIEEVEKGNKNTFIRGEKILVLQSLLQEEESNEC